MSRVLVSIGNRPDVCGLVARNYAHLLQVPSHGRARGWGIGFYQSGEALLRRRPIDERELIEIGALSDVAASLILAQVRTPGVGALRTENTPPFRYRNWLFAQRASVEGFEAVRARLLDDQPEFLRCNVRGETDGEVLFYSVLAALDRAGSLEGEVSAPARVTEAMQQAAGRLDAALEETGRAPAVVDWFLSDGEDVFGMQRTGSGALRHFDSPEELSGLSPEDRLAQGRSPFCCTALASGLETVPEHWQPIPAGSYVLLSRTAPPVLVPA